MEKAKLFGIVGGLIFFVVILLFIFIINSDFDQELIQSVEAGKPSDQLIQQIDSEQEKEIINAKNHLNAKLNDMKNWNKPDIDPENDQKMDIDFYNEQMDAINSYSELRKRFARREISKKNFILQSQDYKLMVT